MNFDENVISFSTMINSDYPVYEEYTTPTPDAYFSQDHGGERSEEDHGTEYGMCCNFKT